MPILSSLILAQPSAGRVHAVDLDPLVETLCLILACVPSARFDAAVVDEDLDARLVVRLERWVKAEPTACSRMSEET